MRRSRGAGLFLAMVLAHLQLSSLACPMGLEAPDVSDPAGATAIHTGGGHEGHHSPLAPTVDADAPDHAGHHDTDDGPGPCAAMMACGLPAAPGAASHPPRAHLVATTSLPSAESTVPATTYSLDPPPPRFLT